jgi:hypothetical protein
MKAIDRYKKFKSSPFSDVILAIRKGAIPCGRYVHLGKTKKSIELKEKGVLFDGRK